MNSPIFKKGSHRLTWVDTHNRHIISMKSRRFFQTPQEIMEEYNGCSVPQYTRYPLFGSYCLRSAALKIAMIAKMESIPIIPRAFDSSDSTLMNDS